VTLNAGQAPTAATVLHLQTVVYSAGQSGGATFTTTETDSSGTTVTFSTATAATCVVVGVGDFEVTTASASVVAVGRLNVDGSTVAGGAEIHLRADSIGRASVSQCWHFSLSGSGSHTIKLRLLKTAVGGVMTANDVHTRIVVMVTEVV
jgi:hypothetical protein